MQLLITFVPLVAVRQCFFAFALVNLSDQIPIVSKYGGQMAWGEIKQHRQDAGRSPCKPAMYNRDNKLNVPHPLTSHAADGDFDTTFITNKSWGTFMDVFA